MDEIRRLDIHDIFLYDDPGYGGVLFCEDIKKIIESFPNNA